MSDITISPIPYNGGTLSMTNVNSHICHLSGNRFFALFSQATPNYLFAATFDLDMTAATPAAVLVRQRVVDTIAPNRIRVWKLNANAVLALVGTDLVVFTIDANGDTTKTSATLSAFHSTTLWGAESASAAGIGPMIQGVYIKDNLVWFTQRTSTTSAIKLIKVEYNGSTLTKTDLQTLVASTTSTHLWRCVIQAIPNTPNFLVFAHGGNTAWSTSTINAYHIISETGGIVQSVTTGIPSTVRHLCAQSLDRVIGFVKTNVWTLWNGSTWGSESYFAEGSILNSTILTTTPIGDYYFIMLSSSSSEMASATEYLRVSRVLDQNLGQTSGASQSSNGVSQANTGVYFDQNVLQRIDDTKWFVVCRPTTTTFRVRSLYQP